MRNLIDKAYGKVMRTPEELWRAGGATMVPTEMEDGRVVDIPDFGMEVDLAKTREIASRPFYSELHDDVIGTRYLNRVVMTDGTSRLAAVTQIDQPYATEADVQLTDGAALLTTIQGYTRARALRAGEELGVSSTRVGYGEPAQVKKPISSIIRLAKSVLEAPTVSLAKGGETQQAIIAAMAMKYDLPTTQYGVGDSQAAMKKAAEIAKARKYGLKYAFFDIKAPCVPDRLESGDIPLFLEWVATETIGGAALIAAMIAEGEADNLVRTASLDPAFLYQSVMADMPALASGEAGLEVDWVPRDAQGHVVLYGKDKLSFPERWEEIWSSHPGVKRKQVAKGLHAHLLTLHSHDLQLGRLGVLCDELIMNGNVLANVDYEQVKNFTKERAKRRMGRHATLKAA